jgi:formate-dependent nitrite reductase membrane component NrfD
VPRIHYPGKIALAAPGNSIRDLIEQGTLRFTVGYKLQRVWGFMEALIFAIEGVGASLVVLAVWQEQTVPLAIGVALLAIAVVLLLGHLGQPLKAWRALVNIRHSWVSRGTFLIGGSVALGILQLILGWDGLGSWSWVLKVALVLDGLMILAYPGFVLSTSPAIPFWNSGLMPVLSFVTGAASGLSVWFSASFETSGTDLTILGQALLALYALLAICIFAYVSVQWRGASAAGQSARRLLRQEAALFVIGACGIGLAGAALLAVPVAMGTAAMPIAWLSASAILRILGDLSLRYSFLRVGLYDPIL